MFIMYDAIKSMGKLFLCACMFLTSVVVASDFVTLTAPLDGSTVAGIPLVVTGTSSQANAQVKFIFNSVDIGSLTTDGSGNFSHSFASIANGDYTLTLNLLDTNSVILATTSISFTVLNAPTIAIVTPVDNGFVLSNPMVVTGTASLTSTTVNVSVDGTLVGTTTTDGSGNWSLSTTLITDGLHTLLAELQVSGITVASYTVDVEVDIANRVVKGSVATTGSGSGTGYTYSVSGSLVTITYVPAFSDAPIITATGLRASGSSTVTIASSTTTAVTLGFSAGTTSIHFAAIALS